MTETMHAIAPELRLARMTMSLWVPQAIAAAAELGIADALAHDALTGPELASRLGTRADPTTRLASALVVLGVLERRGGRFALTEVGQCLRDDVPNSRRAWARLMGGKGVWTAWGKLAECVTTGKPAYAGSTGGERTSETQTFDLMHEDAESAAIFHRAMEDGTRGVAGAIVEAIDFAGASTVTDVGGGHGALLAAALRAHSHLRGAVYDLEHARAGAEALFAREGLADRARFVAGDLFRSSPPPADVVLLKSVLHDWSDERCAAILASIRRSMPREGRLIVVEPIAREATNDSFAWFMAFSDLNMLVNAGGKERDEAGYRTLLERAGFHVGSVRAGGDFYSCFEARPI